MSCAASKVVTVALATIMFVPTARMAPTSQWAGRKVAQPTDYGTIRWVGKGSNGCSALARMLICMRVQRFALAVIDEVSMMMMHFHQDQQTHKLLVGKEKGSSSNYEVVKGEKDCWLAARRNMSLSLVRRLILALWVLS